MPYERYQKLPLIPTRSAMREMFKHQLDIKDIVEVLKEGYDCYKSKRKKGTLEKCVDRKNKTIKTVAIKSYNHSLETDVWAITHVGIFTKRRK